MTAKTAAAQLHFLLEEHAVKSRQWLAAIEAELAALREQNKKLQQEAALILPPSLVPVGWLFEMASKMTTTEPVQYSGWCEPQFSAIRPTVPEGAIRNLRQVYAIRKKRKGLRPAHLKTPEALAAAALKRGNLVIRSSYGQFEAAPTGRVVSFTSGSLLPFATALAAIEIEWFNLSEYYRTYFEEPPTQEFDILDLGYWCKGGRYIEPEADFRKRVAEENSTRGTHPPS